MCSESRSPCREKSTHAKSNHALGKPPRSTGRLELIQYIMSAVGEMRIDGVFKTLISKRNIAVQVQCCFASTETIRNIRDG